MREIGVSAHGKVHFKLHDNVLFQVCTMCWFVGKRKLSRRAREMVVAVHDVNEKNWMLDTLWTFRSIQRKRELDARLQERMVSDLTKSTTPLDSVGGLENALAACGQDFASPSEEKEV